MSCRLGCNTHLTALIYFRFPHLSLFLFFSFFLLNGLPIWIRSEKNGKWPGGAWWAWERGVLCISPSRFHRFFKCIYSKMKWPNCHDQGYYQYWRRQVIQWVTEMTLLNLSRLCCHEHKHNDASRSVLRRERAENDGGDLNSCKHDENAHAILKLIEMRRSSQALCIERWRLSSLQEISRPIFYSSIAWRHGNFK